MTQPNIQNPALKACRGLIKAVFNIRIAILGTIIWACPNLVFSKTETTVKHKFLSNQQRNFNIITRK